MSKVQLKDQLGRVVQINGDATKGATLGVNLYRSDGKTLVTESDVGLSDTTGKETGPLWDNIRQRPENLLALAAATVVGFAVRIGPGQWRQRKLYASGGLTIRNGDGVLGDPNIQMMPVVDSGDGQALVKVTVDQYGRVTATAAATTDDLKEGTTNLYFTTARAAEAAPVKSVVGKTGAVTVEQISTAILSGLANATDDAAAAAAGVSVGAMYRNGSVLCVRVS